MYRSRMLLAFWLLGVLSIAQEPASQIPTLTLRAGSSRTVTQEWVGSVFGSIQCDRNANAYFRVAGRGEHPFKSSLLKISSDGRETRRFGLEAIKEMPEVTSPHVAIGPSGDVFFLLRSLDSKRKIDELWVAAFTDNGDLRWKTRLSLRVEPDLFAVLPSGNLLVGGRDESGTSGDAPPVRPQLWIVDAAGEAKGALGAPRPRNGETPADEPATRDDIRLRSVAVSESGSIYLLNGFRDPVVDVWTEGGQFVRRLRLSTPFANAVAQEVLMVNGQLLVFYQGPLQKLEDGKTRRQLLYAVYDPSSGEHVANLRFADDLKGWLACGRSTAPPSFTVVSYEAGRFAVSTAEAAP
jgi:hypothetical protein